MLKYAIFSIIIFIAVLNNAICGTSRKIEPFLATTATITTFKSSGISIDGTLSVTGTSTISMTGYSKTGSLPITATETVSSAIGKLENTIGSASITAASAVVIYKAGGSRIEFGQTVQTMPLTSISSNTFSTIASNQLTLTYAGTYEICWNGTFFNGNSSDYARTWLYETNTSSEIQSGSLVEMAGGSITGVSYGCAIVSNSVSKTYEIRFNRSANSNNMYFCDSTASPFDLCGIIKVTKFN